MPRSFCLVLGACLVLAGCNTATGQTAPPPPASITSAPIDSLPPSPSPEPSPSEAAVPTEQAVDSVPIPADTYAIVVTDDLRVRSKPGVSDDSKKLEPLLQPGDIAVVLDGPVQASGYDWYLVQAIKADKDIPTYLFGWIAAAAKNGEPWIGPASIECPPLPETVDDLRRISQDAPMYFEITCFGGHEITFQARVGLPEAQCGTEPPWGNDPVWLDACRSSGAPELVAIDAPRGAWLRPRWAPGVDTGLVLDDATRLENWPIVEVTGMFDHPDALTCRNRLNYESPDWPEPDPAYTILGCRMQFVVTSMREIDG